MVFRSTGGFFTTWPGENFLVVIGLSPSDVVDFCTGPGLSSAESLNHVVERSNGGVQQLFKGDGKVPLLLFVPASAESFCDASLVGEGTGLYTENASSVGGPAAPIPVFATFSWWCRSSSGTMGCSTSSWIR
jgi:hypothetical protein